MQFLETRLQGAFIIEPEPKEDARGFFARVFCVEEFGVHELETNLVQCSISFSKQRGTLRGMHCQTAPYEEVKVVRCTRGAVYDVVVDLRPASTTFKQWVGAELTSENHRMMYVPKGFAHGFLTLENNCEVFYQMSAFYHSENERGVRWDDPTFGIVWPAQIKIISEKDRNIMDFIG
jgi:dTDP-4-dehydrorhamnose 3,5-epimerase